MKYNGFTFIHIPKTGGHFLRTEVLEPLTSSFIKNKITFSMNHSGWLNVSDNTYTLTCLRDPVKRTVSHFCHYAKLNSLPVSLFELDKWLDINQNSIYNFQSKFLFYYPSDKKYFGSDFLQYFDDPNFLKISNISNNDLIHKIKNINIVLNEKHLNIEKCNVILNKIINDFNIVDFKMTKPYNVYNINNKSSYLYKKLSKEKIESLYSLNKIDSDLYFDKTIYTDV
jgi:hypothetical protein